MDSLKKYLHKLFILHTLHIYLRRDTFTNLKTTYTLNFGFAIFIVNIDPSQSFIFYTRYYTYSILKSLKFYHIWTKSVYFFILLLVI